MPRKRTRASKSIVHTTEQSEDELMPSTSNERACVPEPAQVMSRKRPRAAKATMQTTVGLQSDEEFIPSTSHESTSVPEVELVPLFEWVKRKNTIIDEILITLDKLKPQNVANWKKELQKIRTETEIEEVSIALVGAVGSGKSSLLNALLNIKQCVPTGGDGHSVTQTAITISASSKNEFEAEIEFYDEKEWNEIVYPANCADEDSNDSDEEIDPGILNNTVSKSMRTPASAATSTVSKKTSPHSTSTKSAVSKKTRTQTLPTTSSVSKKTSTITLPTSSVVLKETSTHTTPTKSTVSTKTNTQTKPTKSILVESNYLRNIKNLVSAISTKTSETDYTNYQLVIHAKSSTDLSNKVFWFITSETNKFKEDLCKYVKCVKLRIPNVKLLSMVTIVDLPGKGDSEIPVSKKAKEFLDNCNAICIVTPVSRCLGDDAKNILDEQFCKKLLMEGRYGTISFICTKADDIDVNNYKNKNNQAFLELKTLIEKCKQELEVSKKKLPGLSNPVDIMECRCEAFELGAKLKQHERNLKEEFSLDRSKNLKSALQVVLSAKIDKIINPNTGSVDAGNRSVNSDDAKVYCVSSTEYLKLCEDPPEETYVFTTIQNTEIPLLRNRVCEISNVQVVNFKEHVVSKIHLQIEKIVNAVQGPNGEVGVEKAKKVLREQRTLLLNEFKTLQQSFQKEVLQKQKNLENAFDLGEKHAIKNAEATCKKWGLRYKYHTYRAAVSQNGEFDSKNSTVDFNRDICDLFSDCIAKTWIDFFSLHLSNIREKVENTCRKCHKRMSAELGLKTDELPSFIEPQMRTSFLKLKKDVKVAQQNKYRLMVTKIQDGMGPAYTAGRMLNKGKGIYQILRNAIEKHVHEHKKDILQTFNLETKSELKKVTVLIQQIFENICDQLICDLTGMYESLFEEAIVHRGSDQTVVLQHLLDVIKQLSSLDDHNSAKSKELESRVLQMLERHDHDSAKMKEVDSRVLQMRKRAACSKDDKPPKAKLPKILNKKKKKNKS